MSIEHQSFPVARPPWRMVYCGEYGASCTGGGAICPGRDSCPDLHSLPLHQAGEMNDRRKPRGKDVIREYELGLVINPDLTDEQLDNQILRIGQSVEGQGGQIVKLDRWGRRRLAYAIEHHRDGYYAFMSMRVDSRAIREIENFLGVQEGIMRHMLTYIDPRVLVERRRREQEEAARIAARAEADAERAAAFAANAAAHAAAVAAQAANVEHAASVAEVAAPAAEESAPAAPTAVTAADEAPAAETSATPEMPEPSSTEEA